MKAEFFQPRERAGLPCLPVGAFVSVEAVSAGGQLEEAGGGSGGLHGAVVIGAVFEGDDFVVDGVREVGGRRVFGDLGFVGEPLDLCGGGRFTEEVSF